MFWTSNLYVFFALKKVLFAPWSDIMLSQTLSTRNLSFDDGVRQRSYLLWYHCIVCGLNRTIFVVNLNVMWLGFAFVLILFVHVARGGFIWNWTSKVKGGGRILDVDGQESEEWGVFENWTIFMDVICVLKDIWIDVNRISSLILSDILHIILWFFLIVNKFNNKKWINEKLNHTLLEYYYVDDVLYSRLESK